MTPNERVVATAARYIGVRENPPGSNRGPVIDKWQRYWNMIGQPWCGMACSVWLREADVTDVSHPSTWVIVQQARQKGWVTTRPVPGALIVWPEQGGRHVEMLVSEASPGVWHCIGGNVGNEVRRTVRALTGCTLVVSPELRHAKSRLTRAYFLEDTAVRPSYYGPWRTKAMRERAIARLSPAKRKLARRVRDGKGYGFTIGRRVYGPWLDSQGRDAAQRVLEQRLGRALRRFSRGRPATGSAVAESLGDVV